MAKSTGAESSLGQTEAHTKANSLRTTSKVEESINGLMAASTKEIGRTIRWKE